MSSGGTLILSSHIVDDLSCRFIVNCPPEEYASIAFVAPHLMLQVFRFQSCLFPTGVSILVLWRCMQILLLSLTRRNILTKITHCLNFSSASSSPRVWTTSNASFRLLICSVSELSDPEAIFERRRQHCRELEELQEQGDSVWRHPPQSENGQGAKPENNWLKSTRSHL